MNCRARLKNVLFLGIISFFIYLTVAHLHSGFFGMILLVIYLIKTSSAAKQMLIKFFSFSDQCKYVRILAIFLSFFTLGSLSGAMLLIYKLTAITIAVGTDKNNNLLSKHHLKIRV